jgi:hypothetical protein
LKQFIEINDKVEMYERVLYQTNDAGREQDSGETERERERGCERQNIAGKER